MNIWSQTDTTQDIELVNVFLLYQGRHERCKPVLLEADYSLTVKLVVRLIVFRRSHGSDRARRIESIPGYQVTRPPSG